jgi:hypothetical protein
MRGVRCCGATEAFDTDPATEGARLAPTTPDGRGAALALTLGRRDEARERERAECGATRGGKCGEAGIDGGAEGVAAPAAAADERAVLALRERASCGCGGAIAAAAETLLRRERGAEPLAAPPRNVKGRVVTVWCD